MRKLHRNHQDTHAGARSGLTHDQAAGAMTLSGAAPVVTSQRRKEAAGSDTKLDDSDKKIATADAVETVSLASTEGNKQTLFVADDGIHGPALWISDGTVDGTRLLKDIAPGLDDPNPGGFMSLSDGRVLFFANDYVHGYELWITDGTSAGTFMLKEIAPGAAHAAFDPVTIVGDKAILNVHTIADGYTLWITDGSGDGTVQLLDTDPTSTTLGVVTASAVVGDKVWIATNSPAANLVVVDAAANTAQPLALPNGGIVNPSDLIALGDDVLFVAGSTAEGRELWVSDGTVAGTVLLKDIRAGTTGSDADELVLLGDQVLFRANDGVNGSELWVTDGTAAGTVMLKDIAIGATGTFPSGFVRFGDEMFFAASGQLWATDGTTAGTHLVANVSPQFNNSFAPVVLDGKLVFVGSSSAAGSELWATDGTTTGTVLLKDIRIGSGGSAPQYLEVVGDKVIFMANDNVVGNELWVTDGTSGGTMLLKDLRPGNGFGSGDPDFFAALGSVALFDAAFGTAIELFVTDATTDGTVPIRIGDTRSHSGNPEGLFTIGGELFAFGTDTSFASTLFRFGSSGEPQSLGLSSALSLYPFGESVTIGAKHIFFASDPTNGGEPWVTDGTAAGTFLLKDVNPGTTLSVNVNSRMLAVGSKAVFSALNSATGNELWVTDGTSAGTFQLKDIRAGTASSNATPQAVLGSRVLITANDGINGTELWVTDGSSANTVLLKNINPGAADSSPQSFFVIGATAYFRATDATNGQELWKTDGTAAGTVLVKNIAAGSASASPAPLGSLGNKLLFQANDGVNGSELWISDGTAAGTTLLKDMTAGVASSTIIRGIEAGGKYYFGIYDPAGSSTLWVTDGTSAGTQSITDPATGAGYANPSSFIALGTKVVFTATTSSGGLEVFVTDGTAAGTMLLRDVREGELGSNPGGFAAIGDKIVFVADDGVHGAELWVTDGTPGGTVLLKDIWAGSQGAQIGSLSTSNYEIEHFFQHDGKLYFQAYDGIHGLELWVTDGTAAGTHLAADLNGAPLGSQPRNFFVADFNDAPTLTAGSTPNTGVTEASSAPNSGQTGSAAPLSTLTISDPDSANLTGATVSISNNFQSGATHQDYLRIGGATSGTASGITFSYDQSTGVMTLTGSASLATYQSVIRSITFSTSGDDITAAGTATSRSISVTVTDGAETSNAIQSTVAVTGINDSPLNNGMSGTFSGGPFVEDATIGAAMTGVTITDVDADPATQDLVMTFSVEHGTLTFLTNVAGGIAAGDITGGANGSGTVTITATQNQINATLAAFGGLRYLPVANFNGNDALTISTNDQGFSGNDPGLSGTGTSEADTDVKTIAVLPINDAPIVAGDGTESVTTILEDAPLTSSNAPTVATLFGGQFSDPTDNQAAFSGSAANTLAGVAITVNGSTAGTGQWQYLVGSTWLNVGTVSQGDALILAAGTQVRFNPALNFNGPTPTLTAHLVDNSQGPVSTGTAFNLSGVGATGGTTRYSTGTVVLGQNVTAVNDQPAGADNSDTVSEGDVLIFAASHFSTGMTDPEGNSFAGVKITTLPTTGTLNLNGIAISAGTVITKAQLDNGEFTYTPAAGSGGSSPSFTFQVRDNGGTANGGIDLDQNPDTFTLDVTTQLTLGNRIFFDANSSGAYDFGDSGIDGVALTLFADTNGNGTFDAGTDVQVATTSSAGGGFYSFGSLSAGDYIVRVDSSNFTGGGVLAGRVITSGGADPDDNVDNDSNGIIVGGAVVSRAITLSENTETTADGSGQFNVNNTLDFGFVVQINSAPVNSLGGTIGTGEDAIDAWLSGMSISDPDADAATDDVRVTFTVEHGTLDIRTDVVGGITAGDIVGDDTGTITVVATLNQINATLAATNGLTYSPDANFNGDDSLTVTSNDLGHNGADPGLSGDATSEEDTDVRTISVSAVNDAVNTTAPATMSVTVNGAGQAVTGLSIGDVDATLAPAGVYDITLSATHGTLTLTTITGLTFTTGDGTDDSVMTFHGVLADLNAALATAQFTPDSDYIGSAQIQLYATDTFGGIVATGTGEATYDGDTIEVTVERSGTSGDDVLTGTPDADTFLLQQGGNDTAYGLGGDDGFYFGAALTGGDFVDGGAGDDDQVGLQGDYSGGLTLDAANFPGIETLSLLPGDLTTYGDPGTNFYDYNITTTGSFGRNVTVNGNRLRVGEDFTFDGSAEATGSFTFYGGFGVENLTGGAGNDGFYFGPDGRFGAGDAVDGGGGSDNQLGLRGDYTIDFNAVGYAGSLTNIQTIALLSDMNPNYTQTGDGEFDYSITLSDAMLGAGQQLTVSGVGLGAMESMAVNGSAETNGSFRLIGGGGNDVLVGGAQADTIFGGLRGDTLAGGAGADQFVYTNVAQSNSTERDGIQDFVSGTDKLNLSGIDANTAAAGDQAFTFIDQAAFTGTAGELRTENISLGGPIWLVQGDTNGDSVSDFEVVLVLGAGTSMTSADFVF